MTPPVTPELNPVSVVVLLLTVLLGPRFAEIAGAYTVILFGWFGGVIVGALRMPPGRVHLAAFVLVSLVLTMGITVPLADFIAANSGPVAGIQARGLLFPLAFALPAVGHSWAVVAAWAWRVVQRRVGGSTEGQP